MRREWRAKEGLQAGVLLVGTFMLLFLFVFPDLSGDDAGDLRAGAAVLWTPMLYGATAVAGRGIAHEHDRGTLETLRSAPTATVMIGASRTLVDTVLVVLLAGLTLASARLLFGVPLSSGLALVLLLGAIGITLVGSLTGALAAQTRASGILLPVLLVPVVAPLLVAGVQATLTVLAGETAPAALLLMAGYDLVAAGVVWLLWPIALEVDA